MKQTHVKIKDAKNGFRVSVIAKNGEMLMQSEVLETVSAVVKNMNAVFNSKLTTKNSTQKLAYVMFDFPIVYKGKNESIHKLISKATALNKSYTG
jgi:uncharacterized protein YegP (UPF0339 family)